MKNRKSKSEKEQNKPFIPTAPGSGKVKVKEKNDPNPNSDPNYGYFPNGAYPTGPDKK